MNIETVNLNSRLQKYGIPEADIKSLRTASPERLDYLDLIDKPNQEQRLLDYVVESQDRPLLFIVDESLFPQPLPDNHYHRLCHTLACRGNRAYLARIRPGELHVFPVETTSIPKAKVYQEGTEEALSFFPRLALGFYDGRETTSRGDFVFKQMLRLVNQVAAQLVSCNIENSDVLSLVGRALFFRFLCDRKIVGEHDVTVIAPEARELQNCFDGAKNATSTCQWLDQTFNGNFLPLSMDNATFFHSVEQQSSNKAFEHLNAIARAYDAVGEGNYQLLLRFEHWTDFDFAHVPVGLLSQVYEDFAHKWDPYAISTSVHYTPRNIAATLVDTVFQGMPNAHEACVLDPACGAGVFLVLAFRQLYRKRWIATGVRPSTQDIRHILMKQLKGFDISESSLKLTALSLYLTAIELDPDPTPPENLRFENLQSQVLFNFRQEKDPNEGPILGSLNPEIGTDFDGQFDIVLSNPPWTSVDNNETLAGDFNKVSKDIIRRRGKGEEISREYRNPDNAPDLPFLWKSMEWCKPAGRIAMALPARILLKQESIPRLARRTLFELLEVNGIINGSNLSDTEVWPDMQQPFMLLLATNRVPRKGYAFHFITPHYDSKLNQRGEVWIDPKSAVPVVPDASLDEPWLWKALTIGTSLDIDLIRKIIELNQRPLIKYWEDDLGLETSCGYKIVGKQSARQNKHLPQALPNLDSTDQFRFLVNSSELELVSWKNLTRPRILDETDKRYKGDPLAVYRAPLVLIKKSPGNDRTKGRALISFNDIAYNESFYGYSAHGYQEPELLARYLHLFAQSNLWMYYALMTSPMIGAERRIIYKSNFDEYPIVPLAKLTSEQKERVLFLSECLIREDSVFDDIDDFFAQLHELDSLDLQVIHDTLDVSIPYKETRRRACNPPKANEHEQFRQRLESLLRPFLSVMGKEPYVAFWKPQTAASPVLAEKTPFQVLLLGTQATPANKPNEALWLHIVEEASKNGATRIFQENDGGLAIAILNQYRYWTPTRARLCAAEIIRRFMHIFEDR